MAEIRNFAILTQILTGTQLDTQKYHKIVLYNSVMPPNTTEPPPDDEYIVWNPVTHMYDPVPRYSLPDPPTGILKIVKALPARLAAD